MKKIPATVTWDAEKKHPIVKPNPIFVPRADGETVIEWTCDDTVEDFEIIGLDPTVFISPAVTNPVKKYDSTDQNKAPGTYHYKVKGKQKGTGKVGEHDPRIENGGGPTA